MGAISDATAATSVLQAAGYSQTKTNCQIVIANQIHLWQDTIFEQEISSEMSDESIAGSPGHYDPGSPEYHPMSPPQYPAPGDYPRSPSYPPSWPGMSPQYPGSPLSSPRYVPTSPSNYPESPCPEGELSSNVVASGGFEFYCPKPDKLSFEIDKIFGLVKADNSVLKFRMVITG